MIEIIRINSKYRKSLSRLSDKWKAYVLDWIFSLANWIDFEITDTNEWDLLELIHWENDKMNKMSIIGKKNWYKWGKHWYKWWRSSNKPPVVTPPGNPPCSEKITPKIKENKVKENKIKEGKVKEKTKEKVKEKVQYFPDNEINDKFVIFLKNRNEIYKKKLDTEISIKWLITKLDKLWTCKEHKMLILDNAIESWWKSFYQCDYNQGKTGRQEFDELGYTEYKKKYWIEEATKMYNIVLKEEYGG